MVFVDVAILDVAPKLVGPQFLGAKDNKWKDQVLRHRGPMSGLGLRVRMLDVVGGDAAAAAAVHSVLHDPTNVVVVVDDDVLDAWPVVQRRHAPKLGAVVDDVAWLALPRVPKLDVAVDNVLVRPRDLKLDVVVEAGARVRGL